MKRRYDLTFTISLNDKAEWRMHQAEDDAQEAGGREDPQWEAGLAAVRCLRDEYGVKAKLIQWSMGRNPVDLTGRGA